MCYHKAGSALDHGSKSTLHVQFRTGINVAGCFVQNQHGRIHQHDAGNAQQLLLPLGQVVALLGQHGIVSVCQAANEAIRMGSRRCGNNFFSGRPRLTIGDVFRHSGLS